MAYLEYNYDKFIFKVKENLYYHEEGYWVEIEKDGEDRAFAEFNAHEAIEDKSAKGDTTGGRLHQMVLQ